MQTLGFAKGHATHNDFVILLDREAMTSVSAQTVRWLCDRRAGIGGDGLLRAVRSELIPEWHGDPSLWFMDYRNADGSIAEMCGNGLRLFVRYLIDQGLVDTEPVQVATRAGLREAWPYPDGRIKVSMGQAVVAEQPTWVEADGHRYTATMVDVGNPHAVVRLDDIEALKTLDLTIAPIYDPADYPAGVNVEFIVPTSENELAMRVFERGVGETQSCGTGVVASAAAQLDRLGAQATGMAVTVPGGTLKVDFDAEQAYLTGPAVVVAHGRVNLPKLG
ncbi:diaminopimelate epimerase [Brooklawnia sp.]|uniref:diaminopimelate epimerase n=1 Tax=Brooklawnia sp. TaxID=2699740 RepID=UPI00311F0162